MIFPGSNKSSLVSQGGNGSFFISNESIIINECETTNTDEFNGHAHMKVFQDPFFVYID